jgi:hypothetical protein
MTLPDRASDTHKERTMAAARTIAVPAGRSSQAPSTDVEVVQAAPSELVQLIPAPRGYRPRIVRAADEQNKALTDLHMLEMAWKRNLQVPERHAEAAAYEAELAAWRKGGEKGPEPQRRGDRRAFHSNVLVEGPTGSGKTSAVQQWCAMKKRPMVTVMPSMRAEHLFGTWVEDADTGNLRWIHGPVTLLALYGHLFPQGAVLYFDELNRIPDEIVPWLYPALDFRREVHLYDHPFRARRISDGTYLMEFDPADTDQAPVTGPAVLQLPPNVLCVASMNPLYAGTFPLNEAFANRFAVRWIYDYDPAVEEQLIACPAIRDLLVALRRTDLDGAGGRGITTPVSPNMGIEFEANLRMFGFEMSVRIFEAHFDEHERPVVDQIIRDDYAEREGNDGITQFFPHLRGVRIPL